MIDIFNDDDVNLEFGILKIIFTVVGLETNLLIKSK